VAPADLLFTFVLVGNAAAGGKLKKTRIDGGDPVVICDAPAGRGGSWGEDGTIVAALASLTFLSVVPAEGGRTPTPLTE
jgi:hypothetical protein